MPTPSDQEDPKLEDVLFYRIDQVMRRSTRYTHRQFAEAGIDLTKDQWLVLKKVHDQRDWISPFEVAKALDKEPASLTRMLDILERKGLLLREPNPNDRRSYLLRLTEAGEKTYQSVLPVVKQIRDRVTNRLSDAALRQIFTALKTMEENME